MHIAARHASQPPGAIGSAGPCAQLSRVYGYQALSGGKSKLPGPKIS